MKYLNLTHVLKITLATSLMTLSTWAAAFELKPFSTAALSTLQQQGKPVAVHFHADWCPVCINQTKSLEALKSDLSLDGMTVLVANYDNEKDLRRSMKVRSQSVMVIFKGRSEVARVNGQTRADDIKAAFVKAL
ncbi:thioredoxin family protein [Laribacter hongkongensis]|uniref:Thioredoxin domain n=1 Tax=Laribacter hongkongensis (strain HLHK9) TaxID=557598 RepID=C1DBQ5_LARHH|nr:thioredoxin family protein [Laribacter hongkongensis]ACO75458.1 Thioredoxin domain precursor [Laribacter hongkongensis HLHK9]MCG8996417.1 thioredoxin family protein [Laribacter hongkongensis]MCG9011764.1 thioredoxin family protein [Laribacter hongkongensis]MCG9022770.1 thioredoxin family protein [Laribacter hongkongensis]MCG9048380.1 thioredoxin family protein [Laribacter hongkongensis]